MPVAAEDLRRNQPVRSRADRLWSAADEAFTGWSRRRSAGSVAGQRARRPAYSGARVTPSTASATRSTGVRLRGRSRRRLRQPGRPAGPVAGRGPRRLGDAGRGQRRLRRERRRQRDPTGLHVSGRQPDGRRHPRRATRGWVTRTGAGLHPAARRQHHVRGRARATPWRRPSGPPGPEHRPWAGHTCARPEAEPGADRSGSGRRVGPAARRRFAAPGGAYLIAAESSHRSGLTFWLLRNRLCGS